MTIGIAIALYNGERFLKEQLDTLRLQTRPANRVVLCDDCSNDGTFGLVEQYINSYGLGDTWKLYKNVPNLGYVKNFYRAVSLCDTDLVFLCDQDDIWVYDKLERMAEVIENRPEICLLACQYGIIDAEGNRRHSIVESNENNDEFVQKITIADIMRAYRWPGMIMCLRKSFFSEIQDQIQSCSAAHDLVFCLCAAERAGFYEYHYVGAYHRRHDNNTAREEHRVFKLLNRERKLHDIDITLRLWQTVLESDIPLSEETKMFVKKRREMLQQRKDALMQCSFSRILRLYLEDKGCCLRMKSLICDLWLVWFSRNKKDN